MFQKHIAQANDSELRAWVDTDMYGRLSRHGVTSIRQLKGIQRTVCAPTVEALLDEDGDICMQVLLPCEFAIYANDVVRKAQARAGLCETTFLVPLLNGVEYPEAPQPLADGLFLWRIGPELMWQQLDRSVDECVSFSLPGWAK